MDSEEENIETDKKTEIQKTVNVLITAINKKPSNKTVIDEIINSITDTFTQDILIQINDELNKIDDTNNKNNKIIYKKNFEYALKKLQLAYSSARKKKNSEEDSSEAKGIKKKKTN